MKTVSVNINLLPLFRSVHSEICLRKKKHTCQKIEKKLNPDCRQIRT